MASDIKRQIAYKPVRLFKGHRTSQLSDQELISLYKQNSDNKYVGYLFDRYIELTYGVCLKYLKDGELSRDMTMDVFEKLLDKLKKHDVNHFKSWLYILVKNTCLEHLRKNKKNLTVAVAPEFMHSLEVPHLNNGHEEELDPTMDLQDCVSKLKDKQKTCVTMFYFEKKSYKEISGLLDINENKVRSYIQNGRRNLKICMEKKNVRQE